MFAKIKFSTERKVNFIKETDLEELELYLGEKITVRESHKEEDGGLSVYGWRETWEKEKLENDSQYTYYEKTEYVKIDSNENYLVDLSVFMEKFPSLEYTVKGFPKKSLSHTNSIVSDMEKLSKKIEKIASSFDESIQFNNKCNIHVPNLGLLNINKLAYCEDFCTESLQGLLVKGWRILAICPQPDQRRPDYILGISVEELGKNVEVESYYKS